MVGVVLLNMGGPDSLESVRPFLQNLFSDREIIQLGPKFMQPFIARMIARKRAPKSAKAYAKIGGKTPLTKITYDQAKALETSLKNKGLSHIMCGVGMRYWAPRTPDTLKELAQLGVKKVIGLSLYPHYSKATTGSSIADFLKGCEKLGLESAVIESYPDHKSYIKGLAKLTLQKISEIENKDPSTFELIYSAHSLPKKMVDEGDPYVDHLKLTIAALEKKTGIKGILCFQSRSGPVEWLTPATDDLLQQLVSKGKKHIVALPISFVSDHIETLYEIDMLYSDMVKKAGAHLYRVPALNSHPDFIECLTDITLNKLEEKGWLE